MGQGKFMTVGPYVPNNQQAKYWDELGMLLYNGPNNPMIFMGDFNSVLDVNQSQLGPLVYLVAYYSLNKTLGQLTYGESKTCRYETTLTVLIDMQYFLV